jgi:hypothetical protein
LALLVNAYKGERTETNTVYLSQNARTSYRDTYESGSARTTYNAPVNFTNSHEMIAQKAVYLIKNLKKPKFGLSMSDLTEKVKQKLAE